MLLLNDIVVFTWDGCPNPSWQSALCLVQMSILWCVSRPPGQCVYIPRKCSRVWGAGWEASTTHPPHSCLKCFTFKPASCVSWKSFEDEGFMVGFIILITRNLGGGMPSLLHLSCWPWSCMVGQLMSYFLLPFLRCLISSFTWEPFVRQVTSHPIPVLALSIPPATS